MKEILILLSFVFSINLFAQIEFQNHVIIEGEANYYSLGRFSYTRSGDIDNDGDLDLISYSSDSNQILFYENLDSFGAFGKPTVLVQLNLNPSTILPCNIYTKDYDNDGFIDIILNSLGRTYWLKNLDGKIKLPAKEIAGLEMLDFSFGPEDYQTQGRNIVDLDGDGDLDYLTYSQAPLGDIKWCEKINGIDEVIKHELSSYASQYTLINTIDIDMDGDLDIFSAAQGGKKLMWFENIDGKGTFSKEKFISSDVNGIRYIRSADMDNDGDLDLVVTSYHDDKISWFENLDGNATNWNQKIITNTFDGANSLDLFDVDSDGDIDVVSISQNSKNLAWFENKDSIGEFSAKKIIIANFGFTGYILSTDIDQDGDLDILTDYHTKNKPLWLENINGAFNLSPNIPLFPKEVNRVITSDIDGDGDLDIISSSKNYIAWFENKDGNGDFSALKIISNLNNSFGTIYSEDIDNDGDQDIITSSSGDNYINWLENIDGKGNFGTGTVITRSVDYPTNAIGGDLDGDGDIDVISSSIRDGKIAWYENLDGKGLFLDQKIITNLGACLSWCSIIDLVVFDLDGDDDLDVIYTINNVIYWQKNLDGHGNFGKRTIITVNISKLAQINCSDIDGDGDLDIVSVSHDGFGNSSTLAKYENLDGKGTFGKQTVISSTLNSPSAVTSADMDKDGDLDIIISRSRAHKIVWLENLDGKGNYSQTQNIYTNARGAIDVITSDLNADGNMDIISASPHQSKITWHENVGILGNNIKGKVDLNITTHECDSIDRPLDKIMVNTDNGSHLFSSFTQSDGSYHIKTNDGDFTTSITSTLPDYYSSSPSEYKSNFKDLGNSDTLNFCLEPNQIINDINISIIPTSQARPGFNATYRIVYTNVGTTILSSEISLDFDDSKLSFLDASEAISSMTNNQLVFASNDINPFESRTINLTFNILKPPTVNIGNILNFEVKITPTIDDYTEKDNAYHFIQSVIGAYDPNDISVLEGEKVHIKDIDDYLHYIVRFQNTGNAHALNVTVKSIIDDRLDWRTMQLETVSHHNRVEIKDGKELSFIFDAIYLVDSNANEMASHGFIAYKIKPKSDTKVGDVILNKANIYFDFNPPVETNTVSTEIVMTTNTKSLDDNQFEIYPNPTTGEIMITSSSDISKIELYNSLGKLITSKFIKSQPGQTDLDMTSFKNGIYFCKLTNGLQESQVIKIIKNK